MSYSQEGGSRVCLCVQWKEGGFLGDGGGLIYWTAWTGLGWGGGVPKLMSND